MLHFYNFGAFFTYINTKTVAEQLQGAWNRFFSIIMVNILDKDQDLIQIKWLEKSNTMKMYNVAHMDGLLQWRMGR